LRANQRRAFAILKVSASKTFRRGETHEEDQSRQLDGLENSSLPGTAKKENIRKPI